ncbi:MAG: RNA 2',3'-cyclic phosphodiesterase [Candidatus Daviesbacteria bacterium]|nr:RNA 2',3'-cyclic phosphodiesterase [Candidatus Daviesbacteria bacterium]
MKEYTSCFIGIPLPKEYENKFMGLLEGVNRIDPNLETVDPKTPHITIYYLDKQSQVVLPKIAKVVEDHASMLSGVNLKIGNLGFFRPGNPRVIFLDVKYPLILSDFNEIIAQNLAGFSADNNNLPFHPHMTIARMGTEEAQNTFAKKKPTLEKRLSEISWNFSITELVLYGVDSTKNPELYEKLITIPVENY